MKKIMIAAAIVCAAAFVQAATYSWDAMGSAYWSSSENYDEFNGYKVYAFDANTIALAALSESLATEGAGKLAMAMDSAVVDGFSYTVNGTGLTDKDGFYNTYLVLVSSDIDGKQYFTTIDNGAQKVTDAVIGGGAHIGADFMMDNMPSSGAAGWTQVAAVPEPTSGLLLLLGVAGLALRRRRA